MGLAVASDDVVTASAAEDAGVEESAQVPEPVGVEGEDTAVEEAAEGVDDSGVADAGVVTEAIDVEVPLGSARMNSEIVLVLIVSDLIQVIHLARRFAFFWMIIGLCSSTTSRSSQANR